jgi:hypothetical protein
VRHLYGEGVSRGDSGGLAVAWYMITLPERLLVLTLCFIGQARHDGVGVTNARQVTGYQVPASYAGCGSVHNTLPKQACIHVVSCRQGKC